MTAHAILRQKAFPAFRRRSLADFTSKSDEMDIPYARVNTVTGDLFRKYPGVEAFASADLKELEKDIYSTGFYHNKAKNIIACCKDLMEKFGGEVPRSLEELTSLAGVGRKTANVIRGNIYHEPSIVVDTHVKRISKKLGLTKEDDPEKVERDLMKALPEERWILWNIHLITFGREIYPQRRTPLPPDICETNPRLQYLLLHPYIGRSESLRSIAAMHSHGSDSICIPFRIFDPVNPKSLLFFSSYFIPFPRGFAAHFNQAL